MKGIARDIPIREEITTVVFTKNDRRVPTGVDKPSSILRSLIDEGVCGFPCGMKNKSSMCHSIRHGVGVEHGKQEAIRAR
jgi:hypothetical protein